MKKNIIVIILLTGLVMWQCSKSDTVKPDLKQSLMSGISEINHAAVKISSSRGFDLVTSGSEVSATGLGTEAATGVNSVLAGDITDSIELEDVAGVYEFNPDFSRFWHHYYPVSLFKKTGESNHLIVNMPQKLCFRPKYLFYFNKPDTALANNFTIDASAYHLYQNGWKAFDYNLAAAFTVNDTAIGGCDINSSADPDGGKSFVSEFTFPEGYSLTVEKNAVDTARSSSFALTDEDDNIVLGESSVFLKTGYKMFEKKYTLTIGDVEIKRTTGIDSIQVFLNGVLQQKAAVKVMDEEGKGDDDENKSICNGRDLLITFDDGTTANLSDLIDPALSTLRTLVGALGDMYFARKVVDYIALSIAYSAH